MGHSRNDLPLFLTTCRLSWKTQRLGVEIIWRFLHSHTLIDALISPMPWLGLLAGCGLSVWLGLPQGVTVIPKAASQGPGNLQWPSSWSQAASLPPHSVNWGIYKGLSRFKRIPENSIWSVSGNTSFQEKHVGQDINLCGHVLVRVLQRTEPIECVYMKKRI